jgi:hypothetical protein
VNRLRVDLTELTAAVADIGTLFPITAALVLVNGVEAGLALGFAGLLFLVAGVAYGVPVPVQPIKAAAAIAIARHASPRVIAAAGLVLGAVLVVLALTRTIRLVARLFPKPIIRGNQLGVGIVLVFTAITLAGGRSEPAGLAIAGTLAAALAIAPRARGPVALGAVLAGIGWSLAHRMGADLGPGFPDATFDLPRWSDIATATTLLVIPQIPLTLGNAIVGTADLEHEYFGARAARVTPGRLALTSGLANVCVGLVGGMPLCHGSSGTTAYARFGARTGGVNLVLGAGLLVAGVTLGMPRYRSSRSSRAPCSPVCLRTPACATRSSPATSVDARLPSRSRWVWSAG